MGEDERPGIAVTGATGRLGGRVARLLAERGVAQRLAVRSPERAPDLAGAVPVRCAYDDPELVRTALDGVETVLMVSGSETPDRVEQHRTFIDAAAVAGVRRLVYISFFGASPTATFTLARDHWATEDHLRASGLSTVLLRDNFYLDFLPELVEADGVIRGPAAPAASRPSPRTTSPRPLPRSSSTRAGTTARPTASPAPRPSRSRRPRASSPAAPAGP
jgi:NAD(P)H dehydrogenase (quinone)